MFTFQVVLFPSRNDASYANLCHSGSFNFIFPPVSYFKDSVMCHEKWICDWTDFILPWNNHSTRLGNKYQLTKHKDWLIELYFSTVKITAQRPTHISAVAKVLLITNKINLSATHLHWCYHLQRQAYHPLLDIKLNGDILVRLAFDTSSSVRETGEDSDFTTVSVKLQAGDKVWVESAGNHSHNMWGMYHTFFAGALLYSA